MKKERFYDILTLCVQFSLNERLRNIKYNSLFVLPSIGFKSEKTPESYTWGHNLPP